jgi:hypothetical protein
VIAQTGRTLLAALAVAALAGCGGAPAPPAAPPVPAVAPPSAPTPRALPPAPAAPAPEAPDAPDARSAPASGDEELPWPARSVTEAAELQRTVDAGAQPWLLDPTEVALSYASAVHGWGSATAAEQGPADGGGTAVDVTGPGGAVRLLVLRQPAAEGAGGIWAVASDTPA